MKRILSVMLVMTSSLLAHSQMLMKVEKSDGTIVEYLTTDVKRVFFESLEPPTPTTPIPEIVDLGLSVKWASFNVGASKPFNSGYFFAWGEVNAKSVFSWDSYSLRISGSNMYNAVFSKYNSGSTSVLNKLELVDDVAHNLWLGDWRIPTKDEFDELINNCVWSWTKVEGVDGYKIVSKKTGFEQNSIFLPAVGFMQRKVVQNNGSRGCYWTSSISSNSHSAYYLGFISTQIRTYSQERYIGCSIRAVCEKK